MEPAQVSISETLGKTTAILHSDGLVVFERMQRLHGSEIDLSFKNISHCTTAFLNASVGKYLLEYPGEKLIFSEVNDDMKRKIHLVISNIANEKKRISLDDSSRRFFYA